MTQVLLNIKSASISDRGLSKKRPQNEDSYLELGGSGLYAVADGVGGAQAGDVASQMAVEILGEAFINLRENGDAEDRMGSAIRKANSAIYQMSRELPQLATMATTLVALHINGSIATIGHVGDSRLYRLDESGVLFQETQDHSVVEEEVRAGRMTRDQALNHPSRNVISRALGAEAGVEIDMKTIMFEPSNSFLVCSDGVTRHIPDSEIKELLLTIDDPTEICRIIKERCYERGAEDNLTAVVVKTASKSAAANDVFELDLGEEETVATARVGSNKLFSSSEAVIPAESYEEEVNLDVLEDPTFPPLDNQSIEESVPAKEQNTEENSGLFIEQSDESIEEEIEEPADLEDTEEILIATDDSPSTEDSVAPAASTEIIDTTKDVKSYRVDEKSGSGSFGRLISGLVWLLVGVLIGALSYFVYQTASTPRTETPSVQANRALVSLEQRRRQADADPGKYIAAFSAKPETAGDHYLLGRAYLLQNNYGAAKTSLEIALEKLDDADVINRAILEYDILAGLTIAQDEAAQDGYESLIEEGQPDSEEPDANSNSNIPKG